MSTVRLTGLAAPVSLLPRWPPKIPAAQQMQVQMRHRLASALLAVDNEPVAVANSQLHGQLGRDDVQMAKEIPIFRFDVGMSRNDLAGDNQHMDRRLRVDIAKGQAAIVLIDDVRWDLLVDDLL